MSKQLTVKTCLEAGVNLKASPDNPLGWDVYQGDKKMPVFVARVGNTFVPMCRIWLEDKPVTRYLADFVYVLTHLKDIPQGWVVDFKNGDNFSLSPDNLFIIKLAEKKRGWRKCSVESEPVWVKEITNAED